jgi:hypothetical protein
MTGPLQYVLQGPSFTVDGNLVCWQKWQFRVGFNYREGLVLHQLGYEDGDGVRPVLHRASLVEMAVPYVSISGTRQRSNSPCVYIVVHTTAIMNNDDPLLGIRCRAHSTGCVSKAEGKIS